MSRFTPPGRKHLILAGIAAVVIALVPSSSALATTKFVQFGGTLGATYSPSSTTISVDDTIVWQGLNPETFDQHPLRSSVFPEMSEDVSFFSHTFRGPGDFEYFCAVHGNGLVQMRGVIHVRGGTPATLTLSPGAAELNTPVTITATSADPDQGDSIVTHDWDLDGDGIFETATGTANTVQTTFTTAGPHVVGLRAKDKGAVEAKASLTIIVSDPAGLPEIPLPDLTAFLTPTPESTPGADTVDATAPTVTASRVPSTVPLDRVLSTGAFLARLRVNEPGRVSAKLRTRSGTVLAKRAQSVPAAGNVAVKLRLTRAGRRALRNAKRSLRVKLSVRVTDLAGNARTLTKPIALRK